MTTPIGAIRPLPDLAAQWWAAENVPTDLPIFVRLDEGSTTGSGPLGLVGRCITLAGDLVSTAWQMKWPWAILVTTKDAAWM